METRFMKGIDNKLGKGYSKKFLIVISIKLIFIVLFSQSYTLLFDKLWQNILLIIFLTLGIMSSFLIVFAFLKYEIMKKIGHESYDLEDSIKKDPAYKYFLAEDWGSLNWHPLWRKDFDSLHIIMNEKKDDIINRNKKDEKWSLEDGEMYDEITELEKCMTTLKFYYDIREKEWVIEEAIRYGTAYLFSRMLLILIIILTLSTENNELKLWIWFYDIGL